MSASEAVRSIEQHFAAFLASAKEKLEQDLPVLASTAAAAESNPVVLAVAQAAHLPEVPELLSAVAGFLTAVDAALGAAKAAAVQPAAEPQP